jgi:hypothetical protein
MMSCYCAECGKDEGGTVSLKMCKSCMTVRYCNANCQRNHWSIHKKNVSYELPTPKEDCPICFLSAPLLIMEFPHHSLNSNQCA